ncbi:hypothetical protein [Streptomyces sp. NBC_00063]|uniref:hypothetical protein n=1 Tax=Streptomyces sp. NBC_00063 TaxID=2975638 RepID=UPI003D7283A3
MVKPQVFAPLNLDDDSDDEPEVTREVLEETHRREVAAAAAEKRAGMTRRSWYTTAAATEALSAAVDDIHFATRVPKHEVVAALFQAAADQAPAVRRELAKRPAQD